MKVTKISVHDGGDGYTTLWVDNEGVLEGDHYHDKIDERIEGYLEGLKYCGRKVHFETMEIDVTELNPEAEMSYMGLNIGDLTLPNYIRYIYDQAYETGV